MLSMLSKRQLQTTINVSLESVYGLGLELYDRELNNKLNIPITEIKTLKQNGWKTNDLATFIFTIGGGFGGIFGWWWFSGELVWRTI